MSLLAHLAGGVTTVARAWEVRRGDGLRLGFTDHDGDLAWDGLVFRAATGMSAGVLVQGSGLAVDNAEALGVLSDDAISAAEIGEGRWDGAEVLGWLVNWADVTERALRFRGRIGEIRQGAGAFHAELRGLTDLLNQQGGRVYHRDCPAVLGDAACGVDLGAAGLSAEVAVASAEENRVVRVAGLGDFAPRWFERGALRVLDGAAAGLAGIVKRDVDEGALRRLELWAPLAAELSPGDTLRIAPGCDKRLATCREKFSNVSNFRGFPHIPGEDWLMAVPRGSEDADGGSLT